ncbi:MAG TPA: LPS assembly lipoprotein LptE [Flavisolibacter sp.]|nr:LPS assembly lipoprotein LptE [Flavisolibacter sp.]
MKKLNITRILIFAFALYILQSGISSCGVYSFNDVSPLPDSIRTVRVQFIENKAPYVNPQLSPTLTERLKQKIVNQTRLTQTNNDNADFDISGTVTDYAVSTSGITSSQGQQQTSINRLTVTVAIRLNNQKQNKNEEFSVSRSFDFDARRSLQSAEAALLDEMIRNLTDEIFNRIFSNW